MLPQIHLTTIYSALLHAIPRTLVNAPLLLSASSYTATNRSIETTSCTASSIVSLAQVVGIDLSVADLDLTR